MQQCYRLPVDTLCRYLTLRCQQPGPVYTFPFALAEQLWHGLVGDCTVDDVPTQAQAFARDLAFDFFGLQLLPFLEPVSSFVSPRGARWGHCAFRVSACF
jgi:hypothetical protein